MPKDLTDKQLTQIHQKLGPNASKEEVFAAWGEASGRASADILPVLDILSRKLAKTTADKSGATINLEKGDLMGTPHTAVGMYPERTLVLPPGSKPTSGRMKQFILANSDLLTNPEVSVGSWVPTKDGGYTLDVVGTPSNADGNVKAKHLGKRYNQQSVFDLQTGSELPTGGSGAAPAGLPPIFSRAEGDDSIPLMKPSARATGAGPRGSTLRRVPWGS